VRKLLNIVAILALWIGLSFLFGHIHFTSSMTDDLIRTTSALGIYGDEAIEDFYMVVTMVLALILSIGIVWIINQIMPARSRPVPT
jgi:DMSO/TMAO reductase YedYZ heme-binding membrane subunit